MVLDLVMNRIQMFSRQLTEGRSGTPGIAPARRFEPLLPPPEDWLSRLGEIARQLPPREAAARRRRRLRVIRRSA